MGAAPSSLREVVLFHHFRRFLERVAPLGIDVAPIKGAHLLTSVYPAGEDRGPLSDVDFLVRPEDFDRACAELVALGFAPVRTPGRPVTRRTFYEAGLVLDLGGGRHILFEPHRHLAQPARHPVDYAALWRRSSPSIFDGAPCRRLAPEDSFLHCVVHLLSHQFVTPARDLRDMELLLERGGVDLGAVAVRAREWECARAAWLALLLVHERRPDLGLSPTAARLAPTAPVAHAVRALVPSAEGFRFPALPLRVRQVALWPLLLDGARPAARFASYYARLRVRDALAAFGARGRSSGR